MAKIGYWILTAIVAVLGGAAIMYGPTWWSQKSAPEAPPPHASVPSHPPQEKTAAKAEITAEIIPEFDLVRVEPSGEIVVAGRAAPNALIVLLRGEAQHDTASADAAGHFAMAPRALPPGTHELRLVATDRNGAKTSKQSVFVSVPDNRKGEAVVALQQPGAPTVNLNVAPPPVGERARVRIFSVDVQTTGLVSASGSAQPAAEIRLYLNDAFIATAKAGANGQWTLTIEKGVTPGLYRLRADDAAADGKVISRAEVQFDVPAVQASAPAATKLAAATPSGTSPATQANVVVEQVKTATVAKGDSLWRISQKIYGVGTRYTVIAGANSDQIRDPNLIYPGQVFVVPAKTP